MRGFVAFLRSQNTHLQWWFGVVITSAFLFVVLGGKDQAEAWAWKHLDGFAGIFNALLEGVAIVALWCWFPALISGIIGRPPWVPQKGFFVAKDIDT